MGGHALVLGLAQVEGPACQGTWMGEDRPAKPCQVGEQGLLLGEEPAQFPGTLPGAGMSKRFF